MNNLGIDHSFKSNIINIAKRMNEEGINQGMSGNISLRVEKGILITPSSVPYKELKSSDILLIDFDGILIDEEEKSPKGRRPSSEWKLHADILKRRQDINSVLHCHSINATAIACHRLSIPSFHYMTAIAGGNDIRCADYATFGTTKLSHNALLALKGRYACLLANHGQITTGKTLEQAFDLAIEVETLAHMYIQSRQLGEPQHLSKEEMNNILFRFDQLKYKYK